MEIPVTNRPCSVYSILVVLSVAASGFAAQTEGTPQPPTTDTPTPAADDHPSTAPTVRLALPEGFDDEISYARSFADQSAKLVAEADAGSITTTQADLLLAAANLILSRELEGPCTLALLGAGDSDAESTAATTGAFDRCDGLIERAAKLVEAEREGAGARNAWLDAAKRKLDALQSFSAVLRAYLEPAGPKEGAAGRRVWSKLSPLLEDEDRGVSSAAALWQACLRSREQDAERAMLVLEPALADPREGSMPYAFFARLTRCRLLADRGGYAAAAALLMQIEERCPDWFPDRDRQQEAHRAVRLAELSVLRQWHDHLKTPEQDEERQWCAERMKSVGDENADEARVLRLSPVVPIVAAPPAPDADPKPAAKEGG